MLALILSAKSPQKYARLAKYSITFLLIISSSSCSMSASMRSAWDVIITNHHRQAMSWSQASKALPRSNPSAGFSLALCRQLKCPLETGLASTRLSRPGHGWGARRVNYHLFSHKTYIFPGVSGGESVSSRYAPSPEICPSRSRSLRAIVISAKLEHEFLQTYQESACLD